MPKPSVNEQRSRIGTCKISLYHLMRHNNSQLQCQMPLGYSRLMPALSISVSVCLWLRVWLRINMGIIIIIIVQFRN